MNTDLMELLREYFELLLDPVLFFVKHGCLVGVTPLAHKIRQRTVNEVYDLFVKMVKLFFRHTMIRLRFNFDDDGKELTDHQIFLKMKVPTLNEFKDAVDQLCGAAHYENRINRGYSFPNLVVKELLVYWLHSPEVREMFSTLDSVLESLDRIQTVEDSVQAVQAFEPFTREVVHLAAENAVTKPAITAQETKPETVDFIYGFMVWDWLLGQTK